MAFDSIIDLESLYAGKVMTDIRFYNIHDEFFVFDANRLVVIDGGVEFVFEDARLLIGWNYEKTMFDTTNTSSISELMDEIEFAQINPDDLPLGRDLVGCKVASLQTKWDWYQNLNNQGVFVDPKHYILYEIILTFEGGRTLQVATIVLSIELTDIDEAVYENYTKVYDSHSNLLLSVDEIMPITDHLKH